MIAENIQKLVSDAMRGVEQFIPEESASVKKVIEQAVQDQLEKRMLAMNLVSKEEFRAHNQLLNRLKEKVLTLEEKLEQLEASQRDSQQT